MYELVIPLASFVAVVALGGALLLALAQPQRRARARLAISTLPGPRPEATRMLTQLMTEVGTKVSSRGPSTRLQQQMARAGFYDPHAPALYLGVKVFLLVAGLLALGLLLVPFKLPLVLKALIALCGAGLLSFVPNLVVDARRQRRRQAVRQHLPDALDLLEICVSAGLGLDAAWNSVAEQMRPVCPVLADEMALTNLELHLGAARAEALRNMADRTGADEVSSLAGALVQSDRFGTSISDMLRTFAAGMREVRSTKAEEAAEKMAVKLLFPMIVFIFPAILLVVAGPAGMALVRLLTD
jgi:tight adherence protein C